ncbi:MAG: hypothetical protein LH481_00820 [Burkholderiales bacterium]|nr:hypothetical protein [Burkholderiales bacterium]
MKVQNPPARVGSGVVRTELQVNVQVFPVRVVLADVIFGTGMLALAILVQRQKSVDGSEGLNTLVSRADEALYSAKKAARNRVVAFPANRRWVC